MQKVSGIKAIRIDEFHYFKNDPKRRSYLDIQRMADSMEKNGFIDPVKYWYSEKHNKNYMLDGKCRILALQQLLRQDKWPSSPFDMPKGFVPSIHIDTAKKNLKEIMLACHGSYSIMTEKSIKLFVGESDIELHHYAFAEGQLIDFYNEAFDVTPFLTDVKRTAKKNEKLGNLLV